MLNYYSALFDDFVSADVSAVVRNITGVGPYTEPHLLATYNPPLYFEGAGLYVLRGSHAVFSKGLRLGYV
jgi:hypothetical protein